MLLRYNLAPTTFAPLIRRIVYIIIGGKGMKDFKVTVANGGYTIVQAETVIQAIYKFLLKERGYSEYGIVKVEVVE